MRHFQIQVPWCSVSWGSLKHSSLSELLKVTSAASLLSINGPPLFSDAVSSPRLVPNLLSRPFIGCRTWLSGALLTCDGFGRQWGVALLLMIKVFLTLYWLEKKECVKCERRQKGSLMIYRHLWCPWLCCWCYWREKPLCVDYAAAGLLVSYLGCMLTVSCYMLIQQSKVQGSYSLANSNTRH